MAKNALRCHEECFADQGNDPPPAPNLLAEALNNMPHGVVMFDARAQLAVCNRRYIEMYGLSEEIVRPGCTLHALITHRKQVGLFSGDVARYCAEIVKTIKAGKTARQYITTTDGRRVHVVNQPIPSGGWVVTHEDITDYRNATAQIEHLLYHDALTGLPNRILFGSHLTDALLLTDSGQHLAVLFVNINNFRRINNDLGYLAGDALLRDFAARLCSCVGETDLVARLGSDDFGVIKTLVRDVAEVEEMAAKIRRAVTARYDLGDDPVQVDVSIGIALAPDDGDFADQLLRNAGIALCTAKAAGSATVRFSE